MPNQSNPGGPAYPSEGSPTPPSSPSLSWDIAGGPGARPVEPSQAEYMPGGKWYGFMDYSVALKHYQHALDAFKNGYWYHGNGRLYTQAQEKHNNALQASGGFETSYGMPTGNLTAGANYQQNFQYAWDGAQWHQQSSGTGSAGGSSGGSTGGSGGSGAGSTPGNPYSRDVQAGLNGLDKYDRDAASAIINLFNTYGLGSLASTVVEMIQRGMGESAIVASLRETKEYKTRFPGMEALRKQGYNAISEGQYLQLEDSYHQALQSAGLPKGFYDDAKDFVGFISNGVDPSELKQRATAAVDLANQVDPSQRELLSSMYGVSAADLAAYFLDPKRAMPILQKQLGTVQIANAAQKAGIQADFANRTRFERLADNGIGAEQAAQGYAQIASEIDPLKNLAAIWGQGSWSLDEAENATFFGNAQANKKRQRLAGQERAAFSGASGFDSRVSGRGATAGSF